MKLKRLFTAVLSAALTLSLCAMPAMAADDTTTTDVWTQNSGSITIHKYEYNGNDAKESTGENTDEKNVPTDTARPLEGATFSIYQVMNRTQLQAYYDGLSNATSVKVEDYLNDTGDAIKADESYSTALKTQTTDANGLTTFDSLALGLYVVVETATPDKVTSPVKPFLVSVPMTKASTLNEWLYDIHVYPKNGTAYGEVKILKTARVGGGAASPLKGVTFTLEKFNATDSTWKPATKSESDNADFNLTTNESGIVSVSGLSQGKYRFIEQSIEGNTPYIIDKTPIEFVVTKEGKIQYNGGDAAAAIEIPVINEGTAIEKRITDKNGTLTNHTDYSIGDHVPYQITVTVPQNIAKLKTFTVTDTPTNLKFDGTENNFSVQCNNAAVETKAYTVANSGDGFTITFIPANMTDYTGKDIIIKYTATLQDTADQTTTGNTNSASLVYTNKIGVDPKGNPTEEDKKETKDEAVVYTFKVKVHKTADDTQKGLSGVEFDLYKEDANGTVKDDAARALGLDASKKWTQINKEKLVSGKDGYLEQGGLANGDYYLVETKTAEGYNLLKSPVKVTLNIKETTTFTKDADGTITKTTTFTGGDEQNIGVHTVNVINRKGFTLPVTGGFGTLLFSGIGVLLVLAGVSVLFSLKKKSNRA